MKIVVFLMMILVSGSVCAQDSVHAKTPAETQVWVAEVDPEFDKDMAKIQKDLDAAKAMFGESGPIDENSGPVEYQAYMKSCLEEKFVGVDKGAISEQLYNSSRKALLSVCDIQWTGAR
ncbi:MAG: hypothetical protein P8P30_04610 [Rickettsiales bacterium]|nr:hypothetical protein [Rickettsiales bacterium]